MREGGRALASAVINSPPPGILISAPKLGNRYLIQTFPPQIWARPKAISIQTQLIQNFLHLHKNDIYAHE